MNPRAGFPTYALHWGVAAGSATAFSYGMADKEEVCALMETFFPEAPPLDSAKGAQPLWNPISFQNRFLGFFQRGLTQRKSCCIIQTYRWYVKRRDTIGAQ